MTSSFNVIGAAALAAGLLAAAGAAQAQSADFGGDPFAEFAAQDAATGGSDAAPGYQLAPGYDRPDFDAQPTQRDEITLFEEAPEGTEPETLERPINVFAGQTQRYDNGVFGLIFGRGQQ